MRVRMHIRTATAKAAIARVRIRRAALQNETDADSETDLSEAVQREDGRNLKRRRRNDDDHWRGGKSAPACPGAIPRTYTWGEHAGELQGAPLTDTYIAAAQQERDLRANSR